MKKKFKTLEQEKFSEESIMEIIVTTFVVVIIGFFFIKIIFF
jgi:hypothetical protein